MDGNGNDDEIRRVAEHTARREAQDANEQKIEQLLAKFVAVLEVERAGGTWSPGICVDAAHRLQTYILSAVLEARSEDIPIENALNILQFAIRLNNVMSTAAQEYARRLISGGEESREACREEQRRYERLYEEAKKRSVQ